MSVFGVSVSQEMALAAGVFGVVATALATVFAYAVYRRATRGPRLSLTLKAKTAEGVRVKRFRDVPADDRALLAELRGLTAEVERLSGAGVRQTLSAVEASYGAGSVILPMIGAAILGGIVSTPSEDPFFDPPSIDPDVDDSLLSGEGRISAAEIDELAEFTAETRSTLVERARGEGRGAVLLARHAETGDLLDFRYRPTKQIVGACRRLQSSVGKLANDLAALQKSQSLSEDSVLDAYHALCEAASEVNDAIDLLVIEYETYFNKRIEIRFEEFVAAEIAFTFQQLKVKHGKTVKMSDIDRFDRYQRIADLRKDLRETLVKEGIKEVFGDFMCLVKVGTAVRLMHAVYQIDGDLTGMKL